MAETNWYVPTTGEIRASATRPGSDWRPEVFDLWLERHDLEVVENEREIIEFLVRELPTTRTRAWSGGWDSVSLEDVLRTVRGEG